MEKAFTPKYSGQLLTTTLYIGGVGGDRTRTLFQATDFKSVVSSYSTTTPYQLNLHSYYTTL